jgi:chitinase
MDSSNRVGATPPQYTTYITTWGTDPLAQVQNMIKNGAIQSNTSVDIAFASYNWDPSNPNTIPGLGNLSSAELQQIVKLIHSVGAKVNLSIGGANSAYNYYGSTMYGQPWQTATYINNAIHNYGFDGIDFDVEGQASSMPADFATQQAEVINTLRNLNPHVFISLTLPAQAWGSGDYQQKLLNLTIGNINTFMPMEYDLWVAPSNTYVQQIQSDVEYYMHNWGIPANKITLGLMPGPNDMKQDLSLQDAIQLSKWAVSQGLNGVMTWDADNDANGIDGNAPYAYTQGIEKVLQSDYAVQSLGEGKKRKKFYKIPDPSLEAPHQASKRKKPKGPNPHNKA